MDTVLAVLMVLGIFVVAPAVIGFAIAGMFYLSGQRALRAEQAKALGEAAAEAQHDQPAAARGEAVGKEPTKERVSLDQHR